MADTPRGGPVVAIIPARGGSKRIPRKNIRPFLGIPLLARTIGILRDAEVFDRIVVSTDDGEVAGIALGAGAEVPFTRPGDLADDHAPTRPVVQHAIQELERESGQQVGPVCCVYPAAIFVTDAMIRQGLAMLKDEGVGKVMTATTYPAPIQRAYRVQPSGFAEMIWPENAKVRSQDLEVAYQDAGQFYWARREVWLDVDANPALRLLLLDRRRVQDIDNPEDWHAAELAYQLLTGT